jgi:NAD(P)-dependent dehydrogenase (short-subunit alcohol dehydrogenase family)
MAMDLNLKGRVAMITGPAKGMGAAITMAFAAEGARLALLGRDTAAVEPVAEEARALGAEAIVVPCDLTEPKQCDDAAATAHKAFGRIDILVNVAGGSGPIGKSGVETTPDEFDDIVTLNMNGCFHTMRAALPAMMTQRYGKIVNVGGTFGMRGRAGRMAYSASNINVNCVAPGMVDGPRFRDKVCTDMANKLGITVDEAVARHAADYALKRVTVDADVANACLFLASDASRQITGIDLPVDGGWAML